MYHHHLRIKNCQISIQKLIFNGDVTAIHMDAIITGVEIARTKDCTTRVKQLFVTTWATATKIVFHVMIIDG